MLRLVVDPAHHGVLEGDRVALGAGTDVTGARGHEFGNRVFPVQRHQFGPQFVVGRVQGHRQGDVALGGQTVDHRHHACGRQGHALAGQAVAQVVAHHAHRPHHVVEVHERLAHAHHHHVGQLALQVRHVAQVARGHPYLADDLGG